jgi:hypothetical protein
LVIVQLPSAAPRTIAAETGPNSLLVKASVAAGACSFTSVSSRAATALAIVCDDEVCRWIQASRFTGSARFVPSCTRSHDTSGAERTALSASRM